MCGHLAFHGPEWQETAQFSRPSLNFDVVYPRYLFDDVCKWFTLSLVVISSYEMLLVNGIVT